MTPFLERALHFLFPASCAACRRDLSARDRRPVCAGCYADMPRAPAIPPAAGGISIEAAGVFDGGLRQVVHSFKYRGRDYLADFLSGLCGERWSDDLRKVDALIPVPSPLFRFWARGYNPALELALGLGRRWGKPVLAGKLRRTAWSRRQTGLRRDDRLENARRSFKVLGPPGSLRGRSILLVDDVCTTGATLGACGGLLRSLGAAGVRAGVIAWEAPPERRH